MSFVSDSCIRPNTHTALCLTCVCPDPMYIIRGKIRFKSPVSEVSGHDMKSELLAWQEEV